MLLRVFGGVPEGSYLAKFEKVEQSTNSLGPGLKWVWVISTGPHAGTTVSSVSGVSPSAKNRCGKLLFGMLGKQLQAGEEVDIAKLFGQQFLVIVRKAESGGTFVDSVAKAPQA